MLNPDLNQNELDDFIDIYDEPDDDDDIFEKCPTATCGHCGEEIMLVETIEDADYDEVNHRFFGYHLELWIHSDTDQRLCRSGETDAYPKERMRAS